ncbi:MAG: hypothetical protein Kow0047_32630 [Anaerolineae bacterium]
MDPRSEREATRRLVLTIVASAIAIWGQAGLLVGGPRSDAVLAFIVAAILFAVSAPEPPRWRTPDAPAPWSLTGRAVAGGALTLAIAATAMFARDEHSTIGLALWLAAMPLYMVGCALEDAVSSIPLRERFQRARRWLRRNRLEVALLLGILALAAMPRFIALDAIPNGCQSDECNNGLDALRWLQGAPYTVYAETNEGQATFFTYLLALSFRLFGVGVAQMRAVSAAVGVLTVLALYILARRHWPMPIALTVALLLAGSRWHLTFSRIIYELILAPLFEIGLLYFLWNAMRSGRRRDWAMTGLILGGGMHTYTAWRVMPLATAVLVGLWVLGQRHAWRTWLEPIAVWLGGIWVALTPLGVYIIRHWDTFLARMRHISIMNDVERAGSYAPLWSNLRKVLWMFHAEGDKAALNNLPGAPLLPFARSDQMGAESWMTHVPGQVILASLVGALFILGIGYALRHLRHPTFYTLAVYFVADASLAVLTVAHEAPSARRPIGLVPLIFLLVGWTLDAIVRLFRQSARGHGLRWAYGIVGVAALGVYLGGVDAYFHVQARDEAVYVAYSGIEAAVGRYVRSLPAETRIYLAPAFQHHSAVKFIGGRTDTRPSRGSGRD